MTTNDGSGNKLEHMAQVQVLIAIRESLEEMNTKMEEADSQISYLIDKIDALGESIDHLQMTNSEILA